VSKILKDWDLKLPHAEFAYNNALSYATKHFPFECVYEVNSLTFIHLLPLTSKSRVNHEAELRAKEMKKSNTTHKPRANAAHKPRANKHRKKIEFSPGDLVWLHLNKEIHIKKENKLMQRRDGPLKIIQKVGYNVYELQLPRDMVVLATF